MKQITINPNNEPYYSEDFIKGFKCGAERQFEADKKDRPSIDAKAEEILNQIYDAVNGINALVDRASGDWIPLNTELIASKYDVLGYHRGGLESDTFMVVRKGADDERG